MVKCESQINFNKSESEINFIVSESELKIHDIQVMDNPGCCAPWMAMAYGLLTVETMFSSFKVRLWIPSFHGF